MAGDHGAGHYPRTTRSLLVAPGLPFPPRHGSALRTWQNVVALAHHGPVAVFGLESGGSARPEHPGIEIWRSSRDEALVSPGNPDALDWLREPDAVPWDRLRTPTAVGEVEALVEEFRPDVVVLSEHTVSGYIEPVTRLGPKVVLDCHQIETVHNRDLLTAELSPVARLVRGKLAERIEAVERDAVAAVDQVWACSESDADCMRRLHPDSAPIMVVPNTVDLDHYRLSRSGAGRGHTVLLSAMWAYPPNESAGLTLATEILPELAALVPDARLVLMGRNPTRRLLDATEGDPRVTVTGAVADARPLLAEAGAMAAPLSAGGGTRYKVLEAFACDVPVVSTARGVAGLEAGSGTHYLRAEEPREFVDAIAGLWSDLDKTARMTERARRFVETRFSWETARSAVARAVERLAA